MSKKILAVILSLIMCFSAFLPVVSAEEIEVLPGDYLFMGESFGDYPDSEDCIKIIEVKDNRRGTSKHWRIVCGG